MFMNEDLRDTDLTDGQGKKRYMRNRMSSMRRWEKLAEDNSEA